MATTTRSHLPASAAAYSASCIILLMSYPKSAFCQCTRRHLFTPPPTLSYTNSPCSPLYHQFLFCVISFLLASNIVNFHVLKKNCQYCFRCNQMPPESSLYYLPLIPLLQSSLKPTQISLLTTSATSLKLPKISTIQNSMVNSQSAFYLAYKSAAFDRVDNLLLFFLGSKTPHSKFSSLYLGITPS